MHVVRRNVPRNEQRGTYENVTHAVTAQLSVQLRTGGPGERNPVVFLLTLIRTA